MLAPTRRSVGRAIRDCWKGNRSDLFVISKVSANTPSATIRMHQQTLDDLHLDYVDLLLMQFPLLDTTSNRPPENIDKRQRQEQWMAMEELVRQGKTRAIGISHYYCPHHIDEVLDVATIRPVINQIEYHVGSSKALEPTLQKCTQENIHVLAQSPLCGPCGKNTSHNNPWEGKVVSRIGQKHNKTGSQVALRFIVQQALQKRFKMAGALTRPTDLKHIQSNRQIFDFQLTQEDMTKVYAATQPRLDHDLEGRLDNC